MDFMDRVAIFWIQGLPMCLGRLHAHHTRTRTLPFPYSTVAYPDPSPILHAVTLTKSIILLLIVSSIKEGLPWLRAMSYKTASNNKSYLSLPHQTATHNPYPTRSYLLTEDPATSQPCPHQSSTYEFHSVAHRTAEQRPAAAGTDIAVAVADMDTAPAVVAVVARFPNMAAELRTCRRFQLKKRPCRYGKLLKTKM